MGHHCYSPGIVGSPRFSVHAALPVVFPPSSPSSPSSAAAVVCRPSSMHSVYTVLLL